ncbi:MAG: HD domain-containing protein [Clostridia bacterium]|nr:HD domain-containing protein [Clostridia bacterium]
MSEYSELERILEPFISDEHVQKMKKYIQHGTVTTYDHCYSVAKMAYRIGRAVPFAVDMESLVKGAMLHDFYLYDWHERGDGSHRMHGFRHAKRAAANAVFIFDADEKVYQIIYCHMWPLNPFRFPRSREGLIVCVADKCVAFYETISMRR